MAYLSPTWRTRIWKAAGVGVFIILAVNVVENALTTSALAVLALSSIMLTLGTTVPRRLLIWYQYRTALIELGFGFLGWHLMGQGATLGGISSLILLGIIVAFGRMINMWAKETLLGGKRQTLIERILCNETWARALRREQAMDSSWEYKEDKEGFLGLKYLILGDRAFLE